MPKTSVVLVCFNRPKQTRATLMAVREVAPEVIFVIADGPRAHVAGDFEACAAVRATVSEVVDWVCEVRWRTAATNLGCEANVELGLDWVFSQVEEAIIIEDDCCPNSDFFIYCDDLLARYRNVPTVRHIAGNSLMVNERFFEGADYAFAGFASVWGWATWRRAWVSHRQAFPRTHDPADAASGNAIRVGSRDLHGAPVVTHAGRRYFADVLNSTSATEFGWDAHWWASILAQRGLAIAPARNLVENIGFGSGGTHTQWERAGDPTAALGGALSHPARFEVNILVARELEIVLTRSTGRFSQKVRKLLGNGKIRALARRASNSRVMPWLARVANRAEQFLRR